MIEAGRTEELRRAVPTLYAAASRAAGLEGLEEAIRPLFATYPQPERSPQEWAFWWNGYLTACGHLPTEALRGALATWLKAPDSEYLPKPGRLAELARQTPTGAFKLADRAHQILQLADDRSGRQRVVENMERDFVKPEAQREAVTALLADYQAKAAPVRERAQRVLQRGVRGADVPEAERPYIGGMPIKGHAITAEMMGALGRPIPTAPPEFDQ